MTIAGEILLYDYLGEVAELYKMVEYDGIEDCADGNDLRGLYTRMIRKNSIGKSIYDRIKAAPKNGTCPYCGHRKVRTIDHYLPQSKFPIFSVSPTNLVPSCVECNADKGAKTAKRAPKQFIHPYFDRLPTGKWLSAEVRETSPASFLFFADPPTSWDSILQQRIINQFNALNLASLYVSHAGSSLSKIRGSLRRASSRGVSGVKFWLEDSAESAIEENPNSWEAAFFTACAESDWFCDGGFLPE